MRNQLFLFLFVIAALAMGGIGLTLLIHPSAFFRHVDNPLQPDSPESRVKMRGIGLVLCLFTLVFRSAVLPMPARFHKNILVAFWLSLLGVPILLCLLWQISVRAYVRRTLVEGINCKAAWERTMTAVFCSVRLAIIIIALIL